MAASTPGNEPLVPEFMITALSSEPTARAQKLPLRERKFARTKLELLHAAVERLRVKPLMEITVKELCEVAQVSEATFFNYFPKKDDLLRYFVQLWALEVNFQARASVGRDAGLGYVEFIFDYTGRQLASHPRMMLEIIAHMALSAQPGCEKHEEGIPLTLAERYLAFPSFEGIEDLEELSLDEMFQRPLTRAVAAGELPPAANLEAILTALISTFFGVPLVYCGAEPSQINVSYRDQLATLWAGFRARYPVN